MRGLKRQSNREDLSTVRATELARFEKNIRYSFKDRALLTEALTHRSFSHESSRAHLPHNERLEFLGDAVLGLSISHLLMQAHPEFAEGTLSKIRASLVNQKSLAKRAEAISLGDFLLLGRGEDRSAGRLKASLLSDAYEALLGAIYCDGGFDAAFQLVKLHFKGELDKSDGGKGEDRLEDFKTALQEKIQLSMKTVPRYELKSQVGPDHDKVFEVEVWVGADRLAMGAGKNKKAAEQNAAREALRKWK